MNRFFFLPLAARSLMNRRVTALLTLFAIALSVMLFLGVEKIRLGATESFGRCRMTGSHVFNPWRFRSVFTPDLCNR